MIKAKRGFTLVELLVVIAIIAILASIGLASYNRAGKNARDAKKRSEIESVRQALILRRAESGNYYASSNFSDVVGNASSGLVATGYLSAPAPSNSAYSYHGTTTQFCVCAQIESGNGNYGGAADAACLTNPLSGTTLGYFCVKNP